MKEILPIFLILFILSGCNQLDTILYEPQTTPNEWCQAMPCVNIGSTEIILNQPFSTFLVYLLGFLWLWAGWRFWKIRSGQKSRVWWCIGLVLGGIAAILAGTSYQAFGYQFKCTGREFCIWTTWWEIAYMVIQVASLNAILIAVAYSCTTGTLRKGLIIYAFVNTTLHFIITIIGVTLPNQFMISFELLVLFSAPAIMLYFIINGWHYFKYKDSMDLILLGAWILLALANLLYYLYLFLGYTQSLWQQGIWFSENDVLHILMIIWVLYVGLVVSKNVNDAR